MVATTTEARTVRPITQLSMFSAVMPPKRASRAMTTRKATVAASTAVRCFFWAGAGTAKTSAGRFLRVSQYWIRPMAMPMAARAKPKWKPTSFQPNWLSSGPVRAPMFTPM